MLAYGMSYKKLADTIQVSEEEAQRIIDTFFSKVPLVKKYLTNAGLFGQKNGYSITASPYNRVRWYEGYQDKYRKKRMGEIERMAKNSPIQGTNADITKLALILLNREIEHKHYNVLLINQIHDEILTETTEEFAEEWKVIMSNIMTDAAKVVLKKVPMVVDCKVMDYWKK